jgi:hypothetical protein
MSKPPENDNNLEQESKPSADQPTAENKKPPKLTLVQKRAAEPGKDKPVQPPEAADFQSKQIDLFHSFVCNGEDERARLSNTLDLWDSVPRYSVSRQAMDKMRKAGSFPQLLGIPFHYRGRELKAVIQPAWIQDKDNEVKGYYPSANEELVEDALRKIATEQDRGYFDKANYRSGVVFTLYMLREELKKRGHARSYQQIVMSLRILARSTIEISAMDGKDGEGFTITPYFSGLAAVSRGKLAEDPQARWLVQFHPLVTQAIDVLKYRQFNYAQMMGHCTQLARWLHKQLSLKFTFASLMTSFEMRFSTIKRDSALLEGYQQQRQAVAALDSAFAELKASGVLMAITKAEVRGHRAKLEDVVYTLTASRGFITQTKAANKRQNVIEEQ